MDFQSQVTFLKRKLEVDPGFVISENGCHLYNGTIRADGYCHITYINEVNSYTSISAQRAALVVKDARKLPKLQASHLCHVKNCINTAHLSLESNVINQQRKRCVFLNKCQGHPGYAACII